MATILWHDARNALRLLRMHPSFAWPALATIAVASGFLGVAANLAASLLAPLSTDQRAAVRPVAGVFLMAGIMVLAAACTNLATLAMSHYRTRLAEFAIRASLGGTRQLLRRQLYVEGLLLSVAACALGGIFAHWSRQMVFSWLSPEQAAIVADGMTLGATLAAGAFSIVACAFVFFTCAGVAAGLGLPLLYAEAEDLAASAKGALPQRRLVVMQVATACSLLITTTLLSDAMNHALRVGPGTAAGEVAVIHTIAPTRYEDPVRGRRFQLAALERVAALPDVRSVAFTATLPLVSASRIGYSDNPQGPFKPYDAIIVSSGYFATMQHPLSSGQEFGSRDDRNEGRVVISEQLAATMFPGGRVQKYLYAEDGARMEIIGVATNARYRKMERPVAPTVYLPFSSRYLSGFHLVARTSGSAQARVAAIAETLRSIDSTRIERQTTLDGHLRTAVRRDRVALVFVNACRLFILLFAVSGPYLLTRHAVTSRYDELAVRLAIGARGDHIFRLVIAHAARASVAGIVIGQAIAIAVAWMLASVTGVTAGATTVAALAVGVILLALSAFSAGLPALRAYRLRPATALR